MIRSSFLVAELGVAVRSRAAALPVVLGEALDGGQRGAQLVAGVGGELAHPAFGPPRARLGLDLRLERGLDVGEHGVERLAQAADLGARIPVGHAPAEVPGGDLDRGLLDLGERPQAGPYHGDADEGEAEHDDRADDQVDADQPPDGLVDVAEVLADDQDAGDLRAETAWGTARFAPAPARRCCRPARVRLSAFRRSP